LLDLLTETPISGMRCSYRGNISPPLDARWHRGGWTSHFEWATQPSTTLYVFGFAVRQSSPWQDDLFGLYAGMNTVAEMKRTDRAKDWPFITSLGTAMLRNRDPRGWLHLFEVDQLNEMLQEFEIPPELLTVRPVLGLASKNDSRLRGALLAEQHFWQELDRLRIRIYRAALRPYVLAIGRAAIPREAELRQQHAIRLATAEKVLPPNPIRSHGIENLVSEAREATSSFIQPDLLQWLPNVLPHLIYL
jgi:hypothetical protein